MEIVRHLKDDELTDLLLASDQQALRETLERLPVCSSGASQQSDEFWHQQRAKVWSRVAEAERRKGRWLLSLARAAVAAVITLAMLMLHGSPAPQTREAQIDPDHEFLIAVERAVQSQGPEALEPAALLAHEMVQARPNQNAPIHKKELTHEN